MVGTTDRAPHSGNLPQASRTVTLCREGEALRRNWDSRYVVSTVHLDIGSDKMN